MYAENVLPLTVDLIVELHCKKLQHLHLFKLHLYIKGYDLRLPSLSFIGEVMLYFFRICDLIGDSFIFKLFLNKLVHCALCKPVILTDVAEDKLIGDKRTYGCRYLKVFNLAGIWTEDAEDSLRGEIFTFILYCAMIDV
jgi:hypothetical protein